MSLNKHGSFCAKMPSVKILFTGLSLFQGLATSGPPTLWLSGDFVNWSFAGSHVPSAVRQLYWAPSTVKKVKNLVTRASAKASSVMADLKIKPIKDTTFKRTETFVPQNALDGSNGTRWMAAETDSAPCYIIDFGKIVNIRKCKVYFVKPTAGHAYLLEYSIDGKFWKPCGGHSDVLIQSPHVDVLSVKAKFLKYVFLRGTPGIWEIDVY